MSVADAPGVSVEPASSVGDAAGSDAESAEVDAEGTAHPEDCAGAVLPGLVVSSVPPTSAAEAGGGEDDGEDVEDGDDGSARGSSRGGSRVCSRCVERSARLEDRVGIENTRPTRGKK